MPYKAPFHIRHRTQGWIAASGFYFLERAKKWLAEFNPNIWMDKNLKASDFMIQDRQGKAVEDGN